MKDRNKSSGSRSKTKITNKYIVTNVLLLIILCGVTIAYFCSENKALKICSFSAMLAFLMVMALKLRKQFKHNEKISDENNALKNSVELKNTQLQRRALSEILKGESIEDDVRELLPQFSGRMSVALVAYCSDEAAEDVRCQVNSLAKDLFSRLAYISSVENEKSGQLWLIADFSDNTDSNEKINVKLEKIGRELIGKLKEKDISTDVIYGRITEDTKYLPDICKEIHDAAFLCKKDGCVISAEKIAMRSCDVYNYSIDTETSIIIYIKKGDFPKAYGMISNALDEIVYQKSHPIYVIRCFMFELAGTILKAIGEIEKENSIRLGCSQYLNNIFLTDSIEEMEHILKEYLKEVCETIAEKNKGVASPFCEKIKQYVRENFADSDMNVNAIAARFYINPAYLSNMFKRNTDIKLLDYINKVRIDEAKKILIANPEITMEELSEKSGFKNSRTFRRIFLKLEDVSPSKFSKM